MSSTSKNLASISIHSISSCFYQFFYWDNAFCSFCLLRWKCCRLYYRWSIIRNRIAPQWLIIHLRLLPCEEPKLSFIFQSYCEPRRISSNFILCSHLSPSPMLSHFYQRFHSVFDIILIINLSLSQFGSTDF